MAAYIVMLGAPGAGKGTQAAAAAKKFGLQHVSSGDLFRENIKNETDLGLEAKKFIDNGALVPDEITIGMVEKRLEQPDCSEGAILDGFPRTPAQAKALDAILQKLGGEISMVPYINVDTEILVARLSGRRICRAGGHVYHIEYNPPKVEGVCDVDGSELYLRVDDEADTVRSRIQVYLKETAPLIAYYQEAGLLKEINGSQTIEKVRADLFAVITGKGTI